MPVSLHIAASFNATWETVLLPWFKEASEAVTSKPEPVAVVTPSPAQAAFLRSRLLENNTSLLGVQFLTPAQLREFLLADVAPALPLREHLRLLLAVAADESVDSDDQDIAAVAKSVSRAPDNLLRIFDRVSTAGWDFESVGLPATRQIIKRFKELVHQCDFELVHDADRAAIVAAQKSPPKLGRLLVTGFTAAHWPLWSLLQAAVFSSRAASVVLEYPRDQTRAADESWIGTWEENFQSAIPAEDRAERSRPFAVLFQAADATIELPATANLQFLVGLHATEQAHAIFALALKFLEEKSCSRLGILFPRSGPLPRLVSEWLTRAGVLHNDEIGHLAPGEFENLSWNAWLDLQENHQLEPLLRFLESHPESLDDMSIHEIRDGLRRVYRSILIDDIGVLREYCARSEDERFVPIAKILQSIKFLPSQTTFDAFLAQTKAIFAQLKWNRRWREVEQLARAWSGKAAFETQRRNYLRWLEEILNSFSTTRTREGDHRYSRVHLLHYDEAEGHDWSHLILAGLNQGEWPQSQNESGFLPDRQIIELNQRAGRRGKQGEGHIAVKKGKTFLLSAQDERQIALRQFASALDSVEHGLAVTANLLQESAPERFWNPSELFSQLYFSAGKEPLTQEIMSNLREKTSAWLEDQKLFEAGATKDPSIARTRAAYDARRRADVPFGEYEFALREPIGREITLRVTEWESAVRNPALVWLKTYLGIENQEPDLYQWNAATGTWVHDWLAKIAAPMGKNIFAAFPPSDQIYDRIAGAAAALRKKIEELCRICGRPVPDWWTSGWNNALALADYLGGKLEEVQNWPQMLAEWRLGSPQIISLEEGHKLRVRGRIDLILAQTISNGAPLADADVWIIDYKTGNKTLAVSAGTTQGREEKVRKKLVRGDAIQLGLYGLAARELGAAEIHLSILSLRTDLDRPQLRIADLTAHSDFWNELYEMQETGVFGVRGLIRNDFAFHADYPLATLPIDKEFLDEKWARTHPAFADDEDDRS